jgi:hypothetical protein
MFGGATASVNGITLSNRAGNSIKKLGNALLLSSRNQVSDDM